MFRGLTIVTIYLFSLYLEYAWVYLNNLKEKNKVLNIFNIWIQIIK